MRDIHKAILNKDSFEIDPSLGSSVNRLEEALELKTAGLLKEENPNGRRVFSKTAAGQALVDAGET